jgi:hypothetical protein
MALDIDIVIKRKNRPSDKDLRELQYHLMHRFGMDTFRMIGEDGAERKRFVDVVEGGDGTFGIRLFLRSRYYERGYERGDGLRAAMMLLYLIRAYPDAEVWYGSDGVEEYGEDFFDQYDEQKALQLLYHSLDVGRLPYLREMDEVLNAEDRTESPVCSFCGIPMIRTNMNPESASFFCAGCGEELKLTGGEHEKWIKKNKSLRSDGMEKLYAGSDCTNEHHHDLEQEQSESEGVSNAAVSEEKRLAERRLLDYLEVHFSSHVPENRVNGPGAMRIPDVL